MRFLKKYFVTGLLIWVPFVITIWVLGLVVNTLKSVVPSFLSPQALFGFDYVADFDQNFNHFNGVEIPNVWNFNSCDVTHSGSLLLSVLGVGFIRINAVFFYCCGHLANRYCALVGQRTQGRQDHKVPINLKVFA